MKIVKNYWELPKSSLTCILIFFYLSKQTDQKTINLNFLSISLIQYSFVHSSDMFIFVKLPFATCYHYIY